MSSKQSLNANCDDDGSFSVGDSLQVILSMNEAARRPLVSNFAQIETFSVPVETSEKISCSPNCNKLLCQLHLPESIQVPDDRHLLLTMPI
ncbi:hypothetical protein QE152_g8151 [Popillia japonica]|uniref:Uncharacterized protein n=1 Tax=Popillia japonica TaxID=7064 RepID=A0AAW1MCA2_POPJA